MSPDPPPSYDSPPPTWTDPHHSASASNPPAGDEATSNIPAEAAGGGQFRFLAPPRAADELGRLGRYRILGLLGQGGMGAVFRAEDPVLRRQVAVKVMLPHLAAAPLARERFLREARAAAKVEHDHVVPIYNAEEDRGTVFLAMPYLKGMSLAAALKLAPRPPLAEVLRVGRQVAEGLAAAHGQGLVHRDIKPANVWLEGDRRRVRILDFGLARAAAEPSGDAAEPLTASGGVLGTPLYMSPEQAGGGAVDHRTDLWSLGVVLYEMATGVRPFGGPSPIAVLAALALYRPPPPAAVVPDTPPALSDLIQRLLAKDPAGRPPTALAVADALARIESSFSQSLAVPLAAAPPAAAPAGPDPWAMINSTDPESVAPAPAAVPPAAPAAAGMPAATPLLVWGAVGLLVAAAAVAGGRFLMRQAAADGAAQTTEPAPPPSAPRKASLTAASKGANKGAAAAAGRDAPPRGGSQPIDLLALIDPKRDTVSGQWERAAGGGLVGRQQTGRPVIEAPYRPPAEYDLLCEFTPAAAPRDGDMNDLSVWLSRGGVAFKWCLGAGSDRVGFSLLDGRSIFNDPGSVRPDLRLENGLRYTTRVEVRNAWVAGYLNDKLVSEQAATFTSSGVDSNPLRDPFLVGLRLNLAAATIHRFEVTERTGRGTFTRGGPPPPAPPANLFNGKDLTGWDGDPRVWRVANWDVVGAKTAPETATLLTARPMTDFELTCRLKPAAGPNPVWVAVRAGLPQPNGATHGPRVSFSTENDVQLLNVAPAGVLKPRPRTVLRPGNFNDLAVRFVGRRLTVTVNDTTLAEGECDLPPAGRVGFMLPGGEAGVVVRDLRLTDLSKPTAPPP